ncbi:MAG: endolytic transglycosylase MltG, partial [Oscillospiraceae bacterium]|nr:endolytic transglycosylase MltG [Oscillospiraceae bacterium]
ERRYGLYWYSGLWRILRPVLIGITALIIVGGLLFSAWRKVSENYIDPPGDAQVVDFSVVSGQSLTRVAQNLEAQGLVRSATVFKYYCDFAGYGQKLQPGDYRLSGDMHMREIADRLTSGDGNPLVRNITLIPGWTVENFAAKLVDDGVLSSADTFLFLCASGRNYADYYYIADVLAQRNVSQRKYVLEGYLAADTYEVYTNATEDDILRKLLSQTERAFPADDQDRAEELGCTMDQILTLASLIEKEAKTSDMAKVSAVFHNRLVKGMRLESDVTIHYITGVQRMDLQGEDLSLDSPYNTYRNAGLPPGPICSPSRDAIQAALYPDESYLADGYLYFCAKDPASGELYFSRTLEEHEQAVAIYAPLWKKWDEDRGL